MREQIGSLLPDPFEKLPAAPPTAAQLLVLPSQPGCNLMIQVAIELPDQLCPVEATVVLNPALQDWIQRPRDLLNGQVDQRQQSYRLDPLPHELERLRAHRW